MRLDIVLNLLIALAVGALTYTLTLYFDHQTPPALETPVRVDQAVPPETAAVVPAFSVSDLNGQIHHIRDFEGKIVVLNFWASWCSPCLKEFPALLEAAENHRDDVVLIALSSDHDAAAMRRFLAKLESRGHVLERDNIIIARDADNRITHDLFQTFRLPETLLIDRAQILRHKMIGADWTPEDLEILLSDL